MKINLDRLITQAYTAASITEAPNFVAVADSPTLPRRKVLEIALTAICLPAIPLGAVLIAGEKTTEPNNEPVKEHTLFINRKGLGLITASIGLVAGAIAAGLHWGDEMRQGIETEVGQGN